ncbi:hypothetical protein GPJ56_007995 [Histomonas meleagridis]|uniref:uncharacterized protein n=1 Tax=Histomonas meleagridis TaxID=135588 RepID=UPI00355A510D|nr:hypothetical protein GPJ56_007995 [Histomonas meleagridis]KAH0803937.1 hypothetical protein GO595_002767 [Histomonas meleagridis]
MELGAEEELNSALIQLQKAVKSFKQQQSASSRMWQNRVTELEALNQDLQERIKQLEKQNTQLQIAYEDANAEAVRLRTINSSISRTLQQKDQEISRFISLNQSLKGLLDQQDAISSSQPEPEPQYESFIKLEPKQSISKQSFSTPHSPSTKRTKPSQTPTTGTSKSSLFIKTAKQELTYSDFNQMISEINLYNRHQQSREDTIKNVQNLLCPEHQELFELFLPIISFNGH